MSHGTDGSPGWGTVSSPAGERISIKTVPLGSMAYVGGYGLCGIPAQNRPLLAADLR